ncbi:hypothetical protein W97_00486 [Coniosporium apollinis CBS 100218]|uniref:HhH-GPD domain-containing protein n=1 Tax=Coniosporium apollinis (strain CBS 100218) TaxID=1168221 RepID=R7YHA4_CONA1|nr:uncharacterized protein W97_00486 [Coniosporium apollinis CBS 100218]EON61273.1 hypothetical protein W97_00486 [Coniosporium apollinis CBS 100218]
MVVTRSQTKARNVATPPASIPNRKVRKSRKNVPNKTATVSIRVTKTRTKAKTEINRSIASVEPSSHIPPRPPTRPESQTSYGLIQDYLASVATSPEQCVYTVLIQCILWNQTSGRQARPVLSVLLTLYPTPADLATANLTSLTAMLQPLGLHNIRAARLLAFAKAWLAAPPCAERRYRKLHYPLKGSGTDIKAAEVIGPEDQREGWEVAHLPGVGAYALDSYRLVCRDWLRGMGREGAGEKREEWEPEWMRIEGDKGRVVPLDKDLRKALVWRWGKEGWVWDPVTGRKRRVQEEGGAEEVLEGDEMGLDQ